MTVEKPIPKLLRPITTGEDSAMNQSEILGISSTCSKQGAIGFGIAFHWLKSWLGTFKPITGRIYCNRGINFDSYLKTAL